VSETVVLLVGDIAWPATVLIIAVIVLLTQRGPIGGLIGRIRKLKIPGGGEAELGVVAEASVAVISSTVESLSRDVIVQPEPGKRAVAGEPIEPIQNREPIGEVEPLPVDDVGDLVMLRAEAEIIIEALAFPPPPGGFGSVSDTLEVLRHRGVLDDKQAKDLRRLIEIAGQATRGAVVPTRVAESVRNSGPTILKQLDKLRAAAGPKFEDHVLLTLRQRLPGSWTLDIDRGIRRDVPDVILPNGAADPDAVRATVDALITAGDRRAVVEARPRLRPGADGQIEVVREWLAALPPELPVLIVMLGERLTERELSWITSGHEGPVELLLWDRDSAELIMTLRVMLERSVVTAGLPAQRAGG
jgi:hypothetical protein